MITREGLVRDLRAAGLGPGQRLIVHSSLRSIGKVRGGAEAVVDALQAVIGPTGTLIMPTFTYSLPMWHMEPFDRPSTPSRTGFITETLRRRPDTRRSDHPTHSFAIWGAHADEVAASHVDAVGRRSPLGWLLENGGLIVQIGTDQETNTALHLCEILAEVPYLGEVFTEGQDFEMAHRLTASGEIEQVRVHHCPGSSTSFPHVEPVLAAAGVVREARVGEARTLVTSLPALVSVVVPVLRRHAGLLLSTGADNRFDQRRRRAVHGDRAQRLTDLIDLYAVGFPGGGRLTWPEREAIEPEALAIAEGAIGRLGADQPTLAHLERHLQRAEIRVEESDLDAFAFSAWEPEEKRIRLWRGALSRLAATFRKTEVLCAAPLREVDEAALRDLALAHEGLHVFHAVTGDSLRDRIAQEVAARLFADRLLQLPAPALLIDVFLMHWAPESVALVPPLTEKL